MKKLWKLFRHAAAYFIRTNWSLWDILIIMSMLRLIDEHRYWDAATILGVGGLVAAVFQMIAGSLVDPKVTINNVELKPELNTAGFAKRMTERFSGRR